MSKNSHTVARAMNDVGLAAWFGGSLMGAIGLNGAAAAANNPAERTKVADAGWARWTPVNLAAIGAFTLGSLRLLQTERGRVASQAGVGSAAALKTVFAVGAGAATAYARVQGQKMMDAGPVPAEGSTEPSGATPPEVASAQRQLKLLQWAIPALTGAALVIDSRLGEQQKPGEVARGVLSRLNPAA